MSFFINFSKGQKFNGKKRVLVGGPLTKFWKMEKLRSGSCFEELVGSGFSQERIWKQWTDGSNTISFMNKRIFQKKKTIRGKKDY